MLEFKSKETNEELERTRSLLEGHSRVEAKKKGGVEGGEGLQKKTSSASTAEENKENVMR